MDILKSGIVALVVSVLVVTAGTLLMPKAAPLVGSITGPVIPFPYHTWGGVTSYRSHTAMQTATTTLCAIQTPSATSTVTFSGWSITTGTSTAATIDIGIGSTAYATTSTLVSGTSVNSGATGAAAYAAANGTTAVVGPNKYLIVKTNGAGLGGYTYTGTCSAEFTVI